MRRVLITGATGFLGSYVARAVLRRGYTVGALMRPQTDRWRIQDLLPSLIDLPGDLTDIRAAREAICAFAPEATIHLAWFGVGNQHRNDLKQIEANLVPALHLQQLVHEAGCRHWIGLGSQAEYGAQSQVIDETTPTSPTTLYGATKLSACVLAQCLCAEYDMRFVWLRLFSSYGPADHPEWMIPYLILTLLRGERPALTGGEQRWDYLYVEDAAEAIAGAVDNEAAYGVFNLGSGTAHSLRSIIEAIRDLIDPALPLGFGEVPYRPDQVMHLCADITRLKKATGWAPRIELEEGLRQTVAWYRDHRERYQ
jgi:UDP-glucose 4-epimerase